MLISILTNCTEFVDKLFWHKKNNLITVEVHDVLYKQATTINSVLRFVPPLLELPDIFYRRNVLHVRIDGLVSALEDRAATLRKRAAENVSKKDASPLLDVMPHDDRGFKIAMVGDSTVRVSRCTGKLEPVRIDVFHR